jgi:hypothetical protein
MYDSAASSRHALGNSDDFPVSALIAPAHAVLF